MPAVTTPAVVPITEAALFTDTPPIRYIVTIVVITHTNTADQNGEQPR